MTFQKRHTPLKLRAEDHQDLKIMGAYLQDSLIPMTAFYYNKDSKYFSILANRFCWEVAPQMDTGTPLYSRVHSGLHFSHVHNVRHKGLNLNDPTKTLNLLTMHGDKKGEIHLMFSDHCEICLHVEKIMCHFHDLHEAWWTHQKPQHA